LPAPTTGSRHPVRIKIRPDELAIWVDSVDTDSEQIGDLGTNDLGIYRCRSHTLLRTIRKACPNSGYFIAIWCGDVTSVPMACQVPEE
jgi:hypothetical protein